jgi:4,5-dihydroxyphthalate decarboxylase
LWNHPEVRPLFPDPVAEGIRYYRKTGIFPINHGMVVKREIAEKHPWAVLNLLKAFSRANDIADQERVAHTEYHLATGAIPGEAAAGLRAPIVRHGLKVNRATLETAARYSHEQGLTPRVVGLEEVFARSAMAE